MLASKALQFAAACAALALLSFGASQNHADTGDALELADQPWLAGDVVHSTYSSNATVHTTVTREGQRVQEFDSIQEKRGTKTVRVLAADRRGPSKLRIEYGALRSVEQRVDARNEESDESAADEIDERNPLQNRVFTLLRQGRTFKVLDEGEARVPDGLARLVLEEECVIGSEYLRAGDRVVRELVGRPLALGREIALSEETASAFVDESGRHGEVRMWVTPKGSRDEHDVRVHVFAARLWIHSNGSDSQAEANVELSGELRLDEGSGRFLSIQLDGILSLGSVAADATQMLEVVGRGPWSIRETARYERSR